MCKKKKMLRIDWGASTFPTNPRIFVCNTASRGNSWVTTARISEKNDIFERKNHTIMESHATNLCFSHGFGKGIQHCKLSCSTISPQMLMLGSCPKNSSVVLSLICPIYEFSDVICKSSFLRRKGNQSCFLEQTYAFSLATTINQRFFGVTTHRQKMWQSPTTMGLMTMIQGNRRRQQRRSLTFKDIYRLLPKGR